MLDTVSHQITEQVKKIIATSQGSHDARDELAGLLELASDIVEGSAFELARMDGPKEVTELILIAARLERMAVMLRETSDAPLVQSP